MSSSIKLIAIVINVRNKHVFIIQSTVKSADGTINDNLMELYLMARAL